MSDFIEQDDWLETTPLNKTSKKKSKSKHSKTKKKNYLQKHLVKLFF